MSTILATAQEYNVEFCGKKYENRPGSDTVTLYLKIVDQDGERIKNVDRKTVKKNLQILENGNTIPEESRVIQTVTEGQRISGEYTFSIMIDQTIPQENKEQLFEAVRELVESAPDSCVYLSFFGEKVTKTEMVTLDNYDNYKDYFLRTENDRAFYEAIYAKLCELNDDNPDSEILSDADSYPSNHFLRNRAGHNKDKNNLFVFIDGSHRIDAKRVEFSDVSNYIKSHKGRDCPATSFFYCARSEPNDDVELTFKAINEKVGKKGNFVKSGDIGEILKGFSQEVEKAKYDFAFLYKVPENNVYSGKPISYTAMWDGEKAGECKYTIGSPEDPWPIIESPHPFMKYFVAILITVLTIAFFFAVVKILVPYIRSKSFEMKYYTKFARDPAVTRQICYYCKEELHPGDPIVKRCEHVMHVECWKQNHYCCSEYGQNCNIGIQEHVEWSELLTRHSIKDCLQAIAGICAGLVSWIVYELLGRSGFSPVAKYITNVFMDDNEQNLSNECISRISSFLMIGVLLAFFLSLVFRYNDEYREKNAKVYFKIILLSVFSSMIGFLAFAFGSVLFCMILSSLDVNYIPWYCSLPAYLLFSVSMTLSLTVKSSIPVKSAMIGGLCSAAIGFIVLYFSGTGWTDLLLNFIIYGGGLGASLVTVRMLAEKYFLVIQNGIKAGTRIPIHKWMNAAGGGNKVTIGMTNDCEIQMNWEKTNKVAKEHAQLYIDQARSLPMLKPLDKNVMYNSRAELQVKRPVILSNGDTFKIGDTIFKYEERD